MLDDMHDASCRQTLYELRGVKWSNASEVSIVYIEHEVPERSSHIRLARVLQGLVGFIKG